MAVTLTGGWSIAKVSNGDKKTYTYTGKLTDTSDSSKTYTVTITGLALSTLQASTGSDQDTGHQLIYVSTDGSNHLTLKQSLIAESSVQLTVTDDKNNNKDVTKSSNFGLEVEGGLTTANDINVNDTTTADNTEYSWTVDANGKATYKVYKAKYYEYTAGASSITYVPKASSGTDVMHLTGLSGLTAKEYTDGEMATAGITFAAQTSGLEYSVTLNSSLIGSGSTVTLYDDLEDNKDFSTILLTNGKDTGSLLGSNSATVAWAITDGENSTKTATYSTSTAEYWSASGSTATHAASSADTLLTIKGLASTANDSDLTGLENAYGSVITIAENAIGTSSISISGNSNVTHHENVTYNDFTLEFTKDRSVTKEKASLTGSSGTYTYSQLTNAGFTFDSTNKVATYSDSSTYNFFTLTGISDSTAISVDQPDGSLTAAKTYTITLGAAALGSVSVVLTDTNGGSTKADNYNYTLSLAEGISDSQTLAPYWAIDGSTDTSTKAIFRYDTEEGWKLNSKSTGVDYHAGSLSTGMATIEGLGKGLDTVGLSAGIEYDATAKTFTLSKAVLGSQSVTLTADNGYSLTLAADVSGTQDSGDYFTTTVDDTAKTTTLKYQHHSTEGWSVASNKKTVNYTAAGTAQDRFSITGLSADASLAVDTSAATISGISVDDKVITISDSSVLVASESSTVSLSGSGYSLSLADDIKYATIDSDGRHWEIGTGDNAGKATFLYKSQAGYSLSGNNKITYTGSATTNIVSVSGLGTTVDEDDLIAAFGQSFSVGSNSIIFGKDFLDSTSKTLVLGDANATDSINFTFGLSSDATVGTLDYTGASVTAGGGKVDVTAKVKDYYTYEGTSTSATIANVSESSKVVAQISGLTDTTGLTVSNDKIQVGKGALTKKADIILTDLYDNDETDFSLEFATDAGVINGHVYDYDAAGWSVANGTALYQQNIKNGYTLNDGGQSITYDSVTATTATYLTITGLSNGALSTGLVKNDTNSVFYLQDDVVGNTDIVLTVGDDDYSDYGITSNSVSNYKLAFAKPDNHSIKESNSYNASVIAASGDTPASATVVYNNHKSEGFELSSDSLKAEHHDSVTSAAFTITGLSTIIGGKSNASVIAGITVAKDTTTSVGTVTISKEILGEQNITLTDNDDKDGINYQITLGAGISGSATADSAGYHWEINGTSATFLLNSQAGYDISGNSVIYTGVTTTKLVTIDGLKAGLSAADLDGLNSDFKKAGLTGTEQVLMLKKDILGGTSVTVIDEKTDDNFTYKLALDDGATLPTIAKNTTTFAVENGSVVLKAAVPEYYTLENATLVSHTSASSAQPLAKLNLTSTDGITLADDNKTIVLGTSALAGRSSINLTDNYNSLYGLSIAGVGNDSWLADKGENEWSVTGTGEAKYQQPNYQGWKVTGDSNTTITYDSTSTDSTVFMTLKGVNSGASAANFSVSGKNVIVGDSAIGTKSIELSIADANGDYKDYGLSFANFSKFEHVKGESYWAAGTTSGTYTYNQDTSGGFTISGLTASYEELKTTTSFTISGLTAGLSGTGLSSNDHFSADDVADKYSILNGVTISKNKITLTEAALNGENVKVTPETSNTATYTLALSGVAKPDDLDETRGYSGVYFWSDSTKTPPEWTVGKYTGAGYSVVNNEVVYGKSESVAFATIKGLSTSIVAESGILGTKDADGKFTAIAGLSAIMSGIKTGGTGVVTLTSDLLGTSSVEITSGSGKSYTLAVSGVSAPTDDKSLYWAVNTATDDVNNTTTTTVDYQSNVSAGFTLDSNKTKLEYQPASHSVAVSFTGLNTEVLSSVIGASGASAIDDYITVDASKKVVTLKNAALSGGNVELTSDKYKLAIADDVATTAADATKFEVANGTATFSSFKDGYYTVNASDSKKLDYTQPTNATSLVTISGLSTDAKVSDFAGIKYEAAVADDASTKDIDETKAEVIGTITVNNNALNPSKDAKVTLNVSDSTTGAKYQFALGSDVSEPKQNGGAWTVAESGGTATYSAAITAGGYVVAADGASISYTEAGTSTDLIKLKGLSTDAKKSDLTVDTTKHTVTIAPNALPTTANSKVEIDATNTLGYDLVIKETEDQNSGYYTSAHKANVWRVNGTTATLKQVTLAYYTRDEATNAIVYHAEQDVTDNDGNAITYVTIENLASGLLVDDKGGIFGANDTKKSTNLFTVSGVDLGIIKETTAAADATTDPKTVTINDLAGIDTSENATGKAKISTADYTFVLGSSVARTADTSDYNWSKDDNGVYYQLRFNKGLKFTDTNYNEVEYAKAGYDNVAKFTGLNSNTTVNSDGIIGYTEDGSFVSGGITASGNDLAKGLTFTVDNTKVLPNSDSSTAKVESAYNPATKSGETTVAPTLALGTNIPGDSVATVNKWDEDKTTTGQFNYSTYRPEHYSLDAAKSTITYTEEKADATALFSVKGLNSDVKVQDGKIGTTKKVDDKDVFTEGITVNDTTKKITLTEAVLGTVANTKAELTTSSGYIFALADGIKTSGSTEYELKADTTDAKKFVLNQQTSAYYTKADKEVTYHDKGTATALATVSGLKSGLTVKDLTLTAKVKGTDGKETDKVVATISTDAQTITLTKDAVDSTVTLDSSSKYKLKLDSTNPPVTTKTTANGFTFDTNTGTATYAPQTNAYYTLSSDGKSLTYAQATSGTALFTISGLSGTADEINKGVTVATDGTVTVSKDVLGTSEVSISTTDTTKTYKLALKDADSDGNVGFDVVENWGTPTNGTVTGTITMGAGYTLDEESNKIKYTAAKEATTVTLTGLNSATAVFPVDVDDATKGNHLGKATMKNGKAVGGTAYITIKHGSNGKDQIVINNTAVLTTSTDKTKYAKLTAGGDSYEIALDSSNSKFGSADYHFVMAKGKTELTYQKNIKAGTYSTDGTTVTYHDKADNSTLAKITGLAKATSAINGDEPPTGVTFNTTTDATSGTLTGGTFKIDSRALDSSAKNLSTITLTNGTLEDGKTAFTGKMEIDTEATSTNKVAEATVTSKYWVVNKGTATYQYTAEGGYKLADGGLSATYYKTSTDTPVFTLTGFEKTLTYNGKSAVETSKQDQTDVSDLGIKITENTANSKGDGYVDSDNKATQHYTVTLSDASKLAGSKVVLTDKTVTSKEDSTYGLATVSDLQVKENEVTLAVNGTTATLKGVNTAGYDAAGTAKKNVVTVGYTKEKANLTYATISGLPKVNGTAAQKTEAYKKIAAGITKDEIKDTSGKVTGYAFTLDSSMLNTVGTAPTSIKLKNGKNGTTTYNNTLAIDNPVTATQRWIVDNKGGATYVDWYEDEGYALSADGSTLTKVTAGAYNEKTKKYTGTSTLFKLTGLKSTVETTTGSDANPGDTITGISVDSDKKKITLSEDVLGTSNVKVTGTGYTLEIDNTVNKDAKADSGSVWSYTDNAKSGTKAVLTHGTKPTYALDDKKTTLKYTKATETVTDATITGLKNGAREGTDFTVDNTKKVITLTSDALNKTKVTLGNKDDYSFEFDSSVSKVAYGTPSFTYSNKKATLTKSQLKDGYTVSDDKKSVTYVEAAAANKKLPTLATLSGIASIDGVSASEESGEVTLSEKVFGSTKITLAGNYGYKFNQTKVESLISTAGKGVTVTKADKDDLTLKNGKLTLTGYSTAGFAYSDANTINYLKALGTSAKPVALATVSGLGKISADKPGSSFTGNTITIGADDTASVTGKVTADGKGIVAFDFGTFGGKVNGSTTTNASLAGAGNDDTISSSGSNLLISTAGGNDFVSIGANASKVTVDGGAGNDRVTIGTGTSSISVIGGAGNDSISIDSSSANVTINAGAGNDYVDMGSTGNSSNLFTYALKDGNDTIANIGSAKIQLASAAYVTIKSSGTDSVLTVADEKGRNAGTITVLGSTNVTGNIAGTTHVTTASTDALSGSADKIADNYFDASPQLSDVLGTSYDAISTDEFNASYDATQLSKQTVVYGAKK